MGIFNVNMPLLYGEGGNAFIRVREEIMRSNYDYSSFAWSHSFPNPITCLELVTGQHTVRC